MEIVCLLPCKHSEGFYCWGLVMVGQVADLVSSEMASRVEDFDCVVGVVVEMAMKVEGSDFEVVAANFVADFVGKDNSDRMEDIDNIEKISHKDFVPLVPTVEIEVEVEAKVAAKNSSLVGVEDTFDCLISDFVPPTKVFL